MNTVLFMEWMKHFNKNTDGSKQRILLLDNFSPHLNPNICKFAEENNILICPFLPNLSHIVQPLDVGFFGPVKSVLSSQMDRSQRPTLRSLINEPVLIRKYYNSREQILQGGVIARSFRESGIYPFHPEQLIDRFNILIKQGKEIMAKKVSVEDGARPVDDFQGPVDTDQHSFGPDSSPSDKECDNRAERFGIIIKDIAANGFKTKLDFEKFLKSTEKTAKAHVKKRKKYRSVSAAQQATISTSDVKHYSKI